jgi:hypothetical protein
MNIFIKLTQSLPRIFWRKKWEATVWRLVNSYIGYFDVRNGKHIFN